MNFQDVSVRAKLLTSFGSLAVLVLAVAGISLSSLNEANVRFENYVNGINARLLVANSVRTAVDRRAIAARNLVLVTDPQDLAESLARKFAKFRGADAKN